MKPSKLLLAAALALALASPAAAQEAGKDATPAKDYQVYDLGEIVVSGEQPGVRQVAISTEVTAEDIVQTHSQTVPEALSYSPGVVVTSGRKNEPEISLHGFEQYETAIFIDGVPYYETNYGKLNLNQLPTEMISRIDVIKGAPSVLYGPNAMAGVINIITKKQGEKPTFSALGEVGQYGAYRLSASHGNSVGKFKYWVNANRRERSAWGMSDDYSPGATTITNRPGKTVSRVIQGDDERVNSDFRQTSIWAKMGVERKPESQYFLSAYYIDSNWGFPPSTESERVINFRPAFSTFGRMGKYDDWGLDLSGEERLNASFKLKGKLFYHNHVDDYVSYSDETYSKEIATSRYKDYFLGGALFGDWKLCDADTLRFAGHYRGDSHQERNDTYLPFSEAFSYTGSLAAENDWRPLKNLSVVAGVSYDWFDVSKARKVNTDKNGDYTDSSDLDTGDTKDSFNPMLGLTYTFSDQTRVFGSVARKTRFPTLSQLYSSTSGNVSLEAEKAINYTIGAARPFGKMFWAQASLFYHDISDRISRDGPHLDSIYRNYASIQIYGVELTGELTPLKDLVFRLNYTWLHARDDSDGRVTDDVMGAPEHKVDFRVTYTVPEVRTRLNLQGLFIAEQYSQLPTPVNPDTETLQTSGYFLANLQVSQPIVDHLEAFGFVGNIFDRDYESEAGYPGEGRSFWIGLKTSF